MRHDDARLLDMLIAARKIQQFADGIEQSDFESNALVQSAVLREIQVIGEAARVVSDATKAAQSEIPWNQIAGMRNRIVHEYFNVDLKILWDTIQQDIPTLVELLANIVPTEENTGDTDES